MNVKEQIAYLLQKVKKQDEKIDETRDVMLWRTKEFKAMVVSTEIANSKAKAMESHLSKYILSSDESHDHAIEWRDKKIKEQAESIRLLENTEKGWRASKMYKEELNTSEECIKELNTEIADLKLKVQSYNPNEFTTE